MLAVIGGSGFENFEGFEILEELSLETPWGLASSGFKRVRLKGVEFLFLSRHGASHELLPSEINYRANIHALKRLGAQAILSFSAVGSLKEELKPGDMVIPYQYIDRTKSLRKTSFTGDGVVGHVSLAHPVCEILAQKSILLSKKCNFPIHHGGTYVCIEGPYFSSQAESHSYIELKAHIIGMTNFPEYALAREAGLSYLPCCFVTDYDCWKEDLDPVEVSEVIKVMKQNNKKGFEFLKLFLQEKNIWEKSKASHMSLKSGLLTPFEKLPQALQELLS